MRSSENKPNTQVADLDSKCDDASTDEQDAAQAGTTRGPSRAAQTVAAAAAGVSAHVGWQLVSRVLNFALRAIVLRTLGPSNVASTKLNVTMVYSLLVLPITGFRKVSLRVADDARSIAHSQLCVVCTILNSFLATFLLAFVKPDYKDALIILAITLYIRAKAEPDVVFTTRRERYAANSRSRAASVLASGVATAIAVRFLNPGPAAASGHLVYSIFMRCTFRYARTSPLPVVSSWWNYLWRDDILVTAANTGQTVLKFLLGNGESIVLGIACEKSEHGAYIMAGNVASIVLRFFHDGLEDQCFNVFYRLSPSFKEKKSDGDDDDKEAQRLCIGTMHLALKASLLVAAVFAAVGPAFSYSVVHVLYGEKWSEDTDAPKLLASYFSYLLFTALNGVTEAFFTASAGAKESRNRGIFSVVLAASYLLSLYALARVYGAFGVIAVNCANMTFRAGYAIWYYVQTTKQSFTQLALGAAPNIGVIVALFIGRFSTLRSERYWIGTRRGSDVGKILFDGKMHLLRNVAGHAVSGAFACLLFVASLWVFEKSFVMQLRRLMKGKSIVMESPNEAHEHAE